MRSPDSRDAPRRKPGDAGQRLPRFAARDPARPGWTAARALEVLHKLLTGGAALAAIIRFLF
jgi:hypothetical protein